MGAAIVEELRLFTPASIGFAVRRTARLVFERVMFERGQEQAATGGILDAIGQTRRTLHPGPRGRVPAEHHRRRQGVSASPLRAPPRSGRPPGPALAARFPAG